MKLNLKAVLTAAAAAVMTMAMGMTAFAGTWVRDTTGWWYDNEDGTWANNGWCWIDSDGSGREECYYFDATGYRMANTTTPDGYTVNADGKWVDNGTVVERAAGTAAGAAEVANAQKADYTTAELEGILDTVCRKLLKVMDDTGNDRGYGEDNGLMYSAYSLFTTNNILEFGYIDQPNAVGFPDPDQILAEYSLDAWDYGAKNLAERKANGTYPGTNEECDETIALYKKQPEMTHQSLRAVLGDKAGEAYFQRLKPVAEAAKSVEGNTEILNAPEETGITDYGLRYKVFAKQIYMTETGSWSNEPTSVDKIGKKPGVHIYLYEH